MDACHRNQLDAAVNVREVERFVAEHARPAPPTIQARSTQVAVVGSGPAGLSAGYALGRLGYAVTLYERDSAPGGLLRTGIPAYRLPPEITEREIANVLAHGVTVQANTPVGRPELAEIAARFAAVIVATGLQQMRDLGLGDHASPRVVQGIEFLDRAQQGQARVDGDDVIVVGGGNTAMDAARSALRLGARSVRIVYRRTRAEMPAIREELEEALEEGVLLDELVLPVGLSATEAGLRMSCARMVLGEPDPSGRRRPMVDPSPGSRFELACTRVILALGSSADLSILGGDPELQGGAHVVRVNGKPVMLCGDLATNEGTVAAAIASGRRAAFEVHRMLGGEDLASRSQPETVPSERIRYGHYERVPQRHASPRAPSERRVTFDEVRPGLARQEALEEAARCFTCGSCTQCDICRAHCPEGIVTREGDDYRFDDDYCKGCGICALECPRGVIAMQQL
jgi:NADPH-dependent glutamate synthase beta subunit-like oxidoreductase